MAGEGVGPATSDGDLTGHGRLHDRRGLRRFDYGYGEEETPERRHHRARRRLRQQLRRGCSPAPRSGSTAPRPPTTHGRHAELAYEWDFDNDGRTDETGRTVTTRFRDAGRHKVALTVSDAAGNTDSAGQTLLVRKLVRCQSDRVDKTGSWRQVRDERANGGSYCGNDDSGQARDVLRFDFDGPRVLVIHGDSSRGGTATRRRSTARSSGGCRSSATGARSASGRRCVYRRLRAGSAHVRIVRRRDVDA